MSIDMNETKGQITQEKLLELLFSQAQHNATREELVETESRLKAEISETKAELKAEMGEIRADIKQLLWFIIATMITVLGGTLGLIFKFLLP